MVERQPSKLNVAGSSPVFRSLQAQTSLKETKGLKVRNLIVSLSILFLGMSVSYAEVPTCAGSKYSIPFKGITFGMKQADAVKKLRADNPSLIVTADAEGVKMKYPLSQQQIFDEVRLLILDGYVHEVLISYSNSFQDEQGGPAKAALNIIKNANEKFGLALDKEPVEGGFRFVWASDNGAGFRVTAKDPYTIVMGYNCEPLTDYLTEKKRKTTNFGF